MERNWYNASEDTLSGNAIVVLAPVIPFIYLEIILEGILKGSENTVFNINYLVEYIIRISVLLICVPLIGFYGIIISYFKVISYVISAASLLLQNNQLYL